MAFVSHNHRRSAVNRARLVNSGEQRISNPVYRECFLYGRQRRIAAERDGTVPADVPLYSHDTTRQGYFARGWHSVSAIDLIRAEVTARVEAAPS